MPSHPSPRGSNFRRFFDVGIIWDFPSREKIVFFRTGQSFCSEKIQKKCLFWGIFPNTFFIIYPFPVMFLHSAPRLKNDVFSGIRKNAVFSSHGSRMTVRKILVIWLAGYLAGWLAIWLALWLAIWLCRWLVGHLAGCLAGGLAGQLANWLAGWRAGWLVVGWLAGYLAIRYLAGWLAIGYLARWLSGLLVGYLAG